MSAHSQFVPLMRQLEEELEDESRLDHLAQQEEEMESLAFKSPPARRQTSKPGSEKIRWLQKALNRVSAFAIAEDGVFSVPTRRALQKFQSENGFQPTGKLGPRGRALLIELSGILPPSVSTELEAEAPTTGGVSGGRCPADSPTVLRGFPKYDDAISLLPQDQQNKLAAIAGEIATSQSGSNPVTQVIVVGHSDMDAAMESRFPGFLQYVSDKRASTILDDLNCRFIGLKSNSSTPTALSGRDWIGVGRGARALAIAAPANEAERNCNRRVEVLLVRGTRVPKVPQPPTAEMASDSDLLLDLYHVALQGTSGQYERAHMALQKAREIAEKALRYIKFEFRERAKKCPALPDLQGFTPYFKDALQGTASKYSDTDTVVNRAAEIAEYAGFGFAQAHDRLEWKSATLPQPMRPDCEIVHGQVPGPANHVLCGPHGHILDTSSRMVIAHDIEEYKRLFRR